MRPSPLALARGALLGVATSVALNLAADPDLWGHLKYGLDVLETGRIAPADTYSFASDRPWVNHEWLFEVLLGLAYRAAGPFGLQLLAAALSLTGIFAARSVCRRSGLTGVRLDAVTAGVFLLGVAPLTQTVRPQAASACLFIALLALQRAHDSGVARSAWWLPCLFCLWANTHGAWVLAGGVLAVWATVRLIESPKDRSRRALYAACAVAALATLVNPHGVGLWRFLLETVRFERADITEWHALSTDIGMLSVWLATSTVLAAGLSMAPREERVHLATCAFLAFASFRVMRILPFYSMAVLLLVVPRLMQAPKPDVRFAARDWAGAVAMWVACVVAAAGANVRAGCLEPRGRFSIDPAAAAFLRENGAAGRLLVDFDWGEYAAWHLAPGLQVSIDGRRESVYSAATIAAHRTLLANGPDARLRLERMAPDYIWLPNASRLAAQLDGWGWRRVFSSSSSAVWVPAAAVDRPWTAPDSTQTSYCFPGI